MFSKKLLLAVVLLMTFAFGLVQARPAQAATAADCAAIGKCESAGACWNTATGSNGCTYTCNGGSWQQSSCPSSQSEQAAAAAAAAANKAEYDRRVAEQQAAQAAADAAARAAAEQAAQEAAARKAEAEQALRDMGEALPTYSGGETYDPGTGQQSTDTGLGTAPNAGSACVAAGKTEPFCGGWNSLFRCEPISIGDECNMRCGLSVDATCAERAGRTELAGTHQTQLDGAMITFDNSRGSTPCAETKCLADQLTIACFDGSGLEGNVCVDREEYRQAELSGGETVLLNYVNADGTEGSGATPLNKFKMYDGTNPENTVYQPAFQSVDRADMLNSSCELLGESKKAECIQTINFALSTYGVDDCKSVAADMFDSYSESSLVSALCGTNNNLFVAGTGVFASGLDEPGETIDGTQGASCKVGVYQTTVLSNGALNTTQRGGDRSSCGAASGCNAGEQRLCTHIGDGQSDQGVLGGCVRTDACAWQVQPEGVIQGGSCAGLRRLSYGESANGQFVGCYDGKNCFCDTLTSASTVQCYADAGGDSCGAAGGIPPTTQVEEPPTTTTSSNPPASPTPTPLPVGPQCDLITASNQAPSIGDQVSFTCTGSPSDLVTRYEFRYGVTTNQSLSAANLQPLAPAQGSPNISVPITLTQVGTYFAQCRPCTANTCLDWEPAQLN